MRSVMSHQFSQVPKADIPRSSFDRSHGYKTTMNAGYLVPFYVDEVVPGDTFHATVNIFMRLATPLHPFMDNMFVDVFFFYCPNRILQTNWPKMMGEQDNPGDSTSFLAPTITSPGGGYLENTLQDYFGWPTKIAGYACNNYLGRMYNQVYNQWFRDQNLQNSVVKDMDDGPDAPSDYVLLRRGKRHDYFTSCLPWPQKGPAVGLPLGSIAPVRGIGIVDGFTPSNFTYRQTGNVPTTHFGIQSSAANAVIVETTLNNATATGASNPPAVYADLSAATAATINQLRQAFQVQRLYERDARGGTRYTEIIQSHFGVTSPDARLQRPEYLGGGSVPLNVNPIAQTGPTGTTGASTPQGNLAAMGTAHMNHVGFSKSFTEHGYLMGLVSIRADLNYQEGLNRMHSRSTRFDWYWPALSHIGEQAVLNKEIYLQGTSADNDAFGYQERWAEMRYKPSTITGAFRSNATTSLDTWHLAQDFSALPVLNASFIVENPPVARVIAVPSEPHFLFDSYIRLKCARPMPVYSVPGMIDHF